MSQHGSMFKQHPDYLHYSMGKGHLFFTRVTPLIDTHLFNWDLWNIILDAHLYMQKHPPCFCSFLFLVSKFLHNCTKCAGMYFRDSLWALACWKSVGSGNRAMTTWTLSWNGISFWQNPSKTSELHEADLVGTISFTNSASFHICPPRDKD